MVQLLLHSFSADSSFPSISFLPHSLEKLHRLLGAWFPEKGMSSFTLSLPLSHNFERRGITDIILFILKLLCLYYGYGISKRIHGSVLKNYIEILDRVMQSWKAQRSLILRHFPLYFVFPKPRP